MPTIHICPYCAYLPRARSVCRGPTHAEDCCRQALDLAEKAHGPQDARTAQARVALAVVLRRAKRLPESEALYREALASLEQVCEV